VAAKRVDCADPSYFTDPANGFHTLVDYGGSLIGFRSFGPDGQVPGGRYDDSALDTGGGLRPDLTGLRRGLGREAIATGLAFGRAIYRPGAFRVTIAAFNTRARRVVESLGFEPTATFNATTEGTEYVVCVLRFRQPSRNSRRFPTGSLVWKRRRPGISAGSAQRTSWPAAAMAADIASTSATNAGWALRAADAGDLEPAAVLGREQRGFGQLGPAEHAGVERAHAIFGTRRAGDLHVVKHGTPSLSWNTGQAYCLAQGGVSRAGDRYARLRTADRTHR
jgi:[ribosomal protein S18]-alanine N-acetyltransferase